MRLVFRLWHSVAVYLGNTYFRADSQVITSAKTNSINNKIRAIVKIGKLVILVSKVFSTYVVIWSFFLCSLGTLWYFPSLRLPYKFKTC